jgi:hypothetical protein
MTKHILLTILLLLMCVPAYGANHYIRADATGNNDGTDWTNAWTDLPATLVRGDTYYIGDGEYGGYSFDDAESGTYYITIKKATVADHGTETGWDNAYGDGQAVFTGTGNNYLISFSESYYVFSGVAASDPSDSSTYGFKIKNTNTSYVYGIGLPHVGDRYTSPTDADAIEDTITAAGTYIYPVDVTQSLQLYNVIEAISGHESATVKLFAVRRKYT